MIKIRTMLAAVLLTASLGLGGCISVFPKAKPVQLYRFGATPMALSGTPAVNGAPFNLMRGSTAFSSQAQSDRILTVSGQQTAYIADARWVSPAVVLFDEALGRAFDSAGGPARLVDRGELASATVGLKLDVQNFEARYPVEGAAPTVVIRVHGVLLRLTDRHLLSDRVFEVRTSAGDNRIGAIVQAFESANADIQAQIVAWTESQGASPPTPATP